MNIQKMLRVIRRHTVEAIFEVMGVVENYRKGQKQLKRLAQHLKSTLARPGNYDRAYFEKLSNASPSNPVGVMKPDSLLLFVQPDRKSLEESTSLEETLFDNFWQKIHEKSSLRLETCITTHCCTHCFVCFSTRMICITLRHAGRAKL